MPGILGGLTGVISTHVAAVDGNVFGVPYTEYFKNGYYQWGYQFAAICTSFGFGVAGGILFGILAAYIPEPFMPKAKLLYEDEDGFVIPEYNVEKDKFPGMKELEPKTV